MLQALARLSVVRALEGAGDGKREAVVHGEAVTAAGLAAIAHARGLL